MAQRRLAWSYRHRIQESKFVTETAHANIKTALCFGLSASNESIAGIFLSIRIARTKLQIPTNSNSKNANSNWYILILALASVPLTATVVDGPSVRAIAQTSSHPVPAHSSTSAWNLYTQNKFNEAADAFESVLKTAPPSARLYYQAAIANFRANRRGRARQLCTYIVTNFGASPEAVNSRKLFPELPSATPAQPRGGINLKPGELLTEENLPPDFFKDMTPEQRERLKTPQGKASLRAAIDDYNKRMQNKTIPPGTQLAMVSSARPLKPRASTASEANLKRGDHPFTAAQIAKDGANGIDQGRNPNCWFEASMAALAELPRGQRLLASMITYVSPGTYVVRFPGDGQEYKINDQTLEACGVHDTAQWASLISCAQVLKFPDNRGAEGATGDQSRLAVGLGCITGCKAQLLTPGSTDPQELSSFIGGAVSSKNPIVCGTYPDSYIGNLPPLVVGSHAYTIIGFDPSSNMITIRNPHGRGSQRFHLPDDPAHRQFEMKEDGVFKMHLTLFQKYFYQVCRSFI